MLCCRLSFVDMPPYDSSTPIPPVPLVLTWHDECDGISVNQKTFNSLLLPTFSKSHQTPIVETMSFHLWLPSKQACGIFMIRYKRFLQSIVDQVPVSWTPAQWHACTIVKDVNELLPVISTFMKRYWWNSINRTYTQDHSIQLVWILLKTVQLKVCFT